MDRYRLAVDTGGTFTDLILLGDNGKLFITKEPTNHNDPARTILEGFRKLTDRAGVPPQQVYMVLHSTTAAINVLLQQKGARTALVTTRGFGDVIFIGRQTTPPPHTIGVGNQQSLLPCGLVYEIDERITADGTVITKPAPEDICFIAGQLRDAEVESVAVCLLHAYANPAHEKLVREVLQRELPGVSISLSSAVLPEPGEFERTSTTLINALLIPRLESYLTGLAKELLSTGVQGELYLMESNGGVVNPARTRLQSARTVFSGPAGGVMAGIHLSELTGHKNMVTMDMGGTGTDISLISNGEPCLITGKNICGYPLHLPILDITTIGAGGNSIARVDAGGTLTVKAPGTNTNPGPACYTCGGDSPTVTDANLVLGRLQLEDIPHLNLQPVQSARMIKEEVARPLGISLEEAAELIIGSVNAGIARTARLLLVPQGHDPRDFVLVPFGGAGPLHAVELAAELGLPRVLVPPHPGVTSAWGMLTANVRHEYVVSRPAELNPAMYSTINDIFKQLTEQGDRQLHREGFTSEYITRAKMLDIRYRGQAYRLSLSIPANRLIGADLAAVIKRFHRRHLKLYGYCLKTAPVELVTLRLVTTGRLPGLKQPPLAADGRTSACGSRQVWLRGALYEVPVYHRRQLVPGWKTSGPAVITQPDSTILIPPGTRTRCDRFGNVIIEIIETGGLRK